MAPNKKKLALNALTLGGLFASQVGLFASPASATDGVVTNCNDDGAGSLRAALEANNLSGGGTITFSPNLNCDTINAMSPLYIDRDVNIVGPGAEELSVVLTDFTDEITFLHNFDYYATIEINFDDVSNENLSDVTISGLTVKSPSNLTTNSYFFPMAAIGVGPNPADSPEGPDELNLTVSESKIIGRGYSSRGISSRLTGDSSITINDSEFTSQEVLNSTYGVWSIGANVHVENSFFHDINGNAVAVANDSSSDVSTVENSTFETTGGLLTYGEGDLEISNSYFGNTGDYVGISAVGGVTMKNSTMVGNIFGEGSLISAGDELVLANNTFQITSRETEYPMDAVTFTTPELTLYGNIIASEQSDAIECGEIWWGGGATNVNDLGGNLFTNAGCGVTTVGVQTDGSSAVVSWADLDLQAPAINTSNPTNTGTIKTIALGENSVARDYYSVDQLDLGDYPVIETDARGVARPQGGKNDVGAYETGSNTCAASENLGSVRFNAYSSMLTKSAKQKLRDFASEINASGCGVVVLTGYTSLDSSVSSRNSITRETLSMKRARTVKKYLSKRLNSLDASVDFVLHAKGSKQSKASNKTAAGRAKNRRVEIVMKPAFG